MRPVWDLFIGRVPNKPICRSRGQLNDCQQWAELAWEGVISETTISVKIRSHGAELHELPDNIFIRHLMAQKLNLDFQKYFHFQPPWSNMSQTYRFSIK